MLALPIKIGTNDLHAAIANAMVVQFGWDKIQAEDKTKKVEEKYLSVLIDGLSVVVEYPYVDKVYRNSYYRYYSGKAQNVPRDCIRLSFLRDEDSSLANQPMKPDEWQQRYKGFIVLRPTPLNVVGRNALSPEIFKENNFLVCKTDIKASVNGLAVTVEAFPASSQDSETMTCAETTVWALMEYFGNRYAEYSPVRPSHIIKLLRNQSWIRQLPSNGLSYEQICFLIKNLNFQPVSFPMEPVQTGFDAIGSFVESGIPVVVLVDNDEARKKDPSLNPIAHAVLCIGHENLPEEALQQATAEDINGYKVIDFDRIRKRFVFIDDNYPAYQMDYLDAPTARYKGETDWEACQIYSVVIPLYERILLMPGLVKVLAIQCLSLCKVDKNKEISIRTFLASSRSYRDYVCKSDMSDIMKEIVLNIYLPKFVWVVELSTKDGLEKEYSDGLLLFDATEPRLKDLTSLDMIYYNGYTLFRNDRQEFKYLKGVPDTRFSSYHHNIR